MKRFFLFSIFIIGIGFMGGVGVYMLSEAGDLPLASLFTREIRIRGFQDVSTHLPSLSDIEQRVFTPSPLRRPVAEGDVAAPLTEDGIVRWTNVHRGRAGLEELSFNDALSAAAAEKAADIFERQYFAHVSPVGDGPADIALRAGYRYILVGENLALGRFDGDEDIVAGWMDSPGHRANILSPRYRDIGVAVRSGTFNGQHVWVGVQLFGLPHDACPTPDAALKFSIESRHADLEHLSPVLEERREELRTWEPKRGREFREKVREYNELVDEYNTLAEELRIAVREYNTHVEVYNECIG